MADGFDAEARLSSIKLSEPPVFPSHATQLRQQLFIAAQTHSFVEKHLSQAVDGHYGHTHRPSNAPSTHRAGVSPLRSLSIRCSEPARRLGACYRVTRYCGFELPAFNKSCALQSNWVFDMPGGTKAVRGNTGAGPRRCRRTAEKTLCEESRPWQEDEIEEQS